MSESNPLLSVASAVVASNIVSTNNGNGSGNNDPNSQQQQQQQAKDYSGACGCFWWFYDGPYCVKQRLIFMGWIAIAILSPVFYGIYLNLSDEGAILNYGFILCCILAILMSLYATFNFRDVINLKNAVNDLVESTKLLSQQRDMVRGEVDKLQTAHTKLEGIEDELATSNTALRKNFKKFESWNETIQRETANNVENAQVINKDFRNAIQQYQRMLIQNEKAILDKAYQHIEGRDGKKGLNKDEFNDLLYSLPARYKLRFEKLGRTFEDFAGQDMNIDHDEFKKFMNEMAQQEANCGVEMPQFGITSKKKRIYNQNDDDDDDDGKDDEKTGN